MLSNQPSSLPRNLPPVVRTLTQEKIERYGRATGDLNPVHMDPSVAASSRFGGTIAHGMLVLAYISESLIAGLGHHWLQGGRLKAKFRSVARPGDTVTVNGSLKSARVSGGERVQYLTYTLDAYNQEGDLLITSEAEVLSPLPAKRAGMPAGVPTV